MQRIITLLIVCLSLNASANKTAAEIYVDLQKLYSLKRVLYIAAHPDDENTRFLAYMSLGEKAETAYLSLTRGDGGQNLIGDELGAELGVLRTQELLAARSYDGANQFFSRAVDFGYSKSAEETLEKWGKDEILSDVVRVIRQFKPDIIVTRFPPDRRGGHGHHTASAMLAIEAFNKAADPEFLPDQVTKFGAWETASIYWNTSYWWMKDIADSAAKYPDRYFVKDIGGYNNLLGMSYNEIGTIARSQHKCQGFGAIKERGPRMEYFEYLDGKPINEDFFEHANRSWTTIVDAEFEKQLKDLLDNFDFLHPEKNVEQLVGIRERLLEQERSTLIQEKIDICNKLIINCLGLYLEVLDEDYSFVPGNQLDLKLSIVNRSMIPIHIDRVFINGEQTEIEATEVPSNTATEIEFSSKPEASLSIPYWLKKPYENLFHPTHESLIGKAENEPALMSEIEMTIAGKSLHMRYPVTYKWRDPSFGERRRDLISTPTFCANFDTDMLILKAEDEKKIRVNVHAFKDSLRDKVMLIAPEGWEVSPKSQDISIHQKHEEKWVEFTVKADKKAKDGEFWLLDSYGTRVHSITEITYDHIPTQTIIKEAEIPCVNLDVAIKPGKVAYIKGVQDAVPVAIEQLGFEVDLFEVNDLANLDLSKYQTVVLGIRIYNVHEELFNYNDKLYSYVEGGGNLIMQYNTRSRSLRGREFGPKPFQLSRNRVTEEDAAVTFLNPKHPILNQPNKITQQDFDGWVQERGLYFADEWDEAYQPLFSWNDKGEDPQKGALIVLKHGDGQFIYTGISFFRELPKGVEGAYRLFANLLSYEGE